jgi:UDP-N-acetylglucosamine--dolichyl-phosphate N-acetylglucosaminephosphotransferase
MSLLPFLVAFIMTFISTPTVARFFFKKNIVGFDLHKEGEIKIPEMGGVTVFFTTLAVLLYYYQVGFDQLFYPIITLLIIGLLGIFDGLYRLSAIQKILSFFVVGLFLAMGLGFKGVAAYLVIGFLFMAAVNFTNMLAGFNGLEIGTGAIASIGLAIVSWLSGEAISFILTSTMAGALLGFLYFNRYPASVFPGDVGTLIIGSALFSAVLIGRLIVPGLLIFTPYILDAFLKFFSAGVMTRESQKPTLLKEGKLYVPKGSNLSLARLFMRREAMEEKEVVLKVWSLEVLFVVLAVGYTVLL